MTTTLHPVHPGDILLEEFLKPIHLSQTALALHLRVPPQRINEIARGKRPITLDTALRLAEFFGNSPEFWLNLQMEYDLRRSRREGVVRQIQREITCRASELGVG